MSGPVGARPATVAIVGRQNVGKSTLVNRLAGRREAIAHELPGVTRDRVEVEASWRGRTFALVDTGGYTSRASGVEASAAEQARRAEEAADVVLLVVDATTGIQEEDAELARRLRRATAPVVVVVNKVDGPRQEALVQEFLRLGLGEPLVVSALHGRGSSDVLERLLDLLPDKPPVEVEDEARFALVGRPNVGKSSLFNRLVGESRAVVDTVAGTTRDAVDSLVDFDGARARFVDTAGLRREVKTRGIEYYGLLRSLRAIERSQVVLLVIDAAEGFTGEDKRIAAKVGETGRGLVIALNKWDLVPTGDRADRFLDLSMEARIVPGAPVVRTSALTGLGVGRVAPALFGVHRAWSTRAPTAEVNRALATATGAHPVPRGGGRILYGTQVSAGPPTFVLFGAAEPGAAYRRYLEGTLRSTFGFDGVPVRLTFRPKERRGAAGGAPRGARRRGR